MTPAYRAMSFLGAVSAAPRFKAKRWQQRPEPKGGNIGAAVRVRRRKKNRVVLQA